MRYGMMRGDKKGNDRRAHKFTVNSLNGSNKQTIAGSICVPKALSHTSSWMIVLLPSTACGSIRSTEIADGGPLRLRTEE
jgi:hypothetical protein